MCAQSMALGTHKKFQLEIIIRSTISAIHKFRKNILESSRNVSETTPWCCRLEQIHLLLKPRQSFFVHNQVSWHINILCTLWLSCYDNSNKAIEIEFDIEHNRQDAVILPCSVWNFTRNGALKIGYGQTRFSGVWNIFIHLKFKMS